MKAQQAARELWSGERYDDYTRRADPIMLALALVFLVVWSALNIRDGLSTLELSIYWGLHGIIWAAFIADLAIRSFLAENSWRYIVTHPMDLATVVMPALRPLKILAVFTNSSSFLAGRAFGRSGAAVGVTAALVIWMGAVVVYNVEHEAPGTQIESFGESLWWSIVTTTTVGYGDYAPITTTGRVAAAILMLLGIAILGAVTATVSAWFVRKTTHTTAEEETASIAKNAQEIRALGRKVASLEAKLDLLLERQSRPE